MSDDKRVEPIVPEGKAKTKKSILERSKFAQLFFSEDAGHTLEYVAEDVLVPKGKDLLVSILKAAVETFVYGRGGYSGGSTKTSSFSYGSYYEDKKPKAYSGSKSDDPIFEEIVWPDLKTANEACAHIDSLIKTYGAARVSDMYDLARLKVPYTAERWGWTDFKSAKTVRVPNGYIIKTPKAMPID